MGGGEKVEVVAGEAVLLLGAGEMDAKRSFIFAP